MDILYLTGGKVQWIIIQRADARWCDTKFELLGRVLTFGRKPLRLSRTVMRAGYHLSEALPLTSSPLILLRI